jgi:AraC-like DNA-binding protein
LSAKREMYMKEKNSSLAILREPFIAGTDENLSPVMHHLWKLEGGAIYFCRKGWAHATIDLKDYEIVENTQVVLLPGTIIRINGCSSDFTASFFGFPKEMFMEACMRFEPIFFRFIKEQPCYVLPQENTGAINGLIRATTAIYNDRENRFRNQIAKNHLQSFMLDIYDKCYRYFGKHKIEGGTRQDEIFKSFVSLVHEHCTSQREVSFYADKLCISTKYLTGICKAVTGDSAKKIIDDFAILEIKVLLQSTELTVQEIADRLSFPDQSYLGRYFKRHEGISPKEYQNKYSI